MCPCSMRANGTPPRGKRWSSIRSQSPLTDFDLADLIGLVQALYSASQGLKIFLYARFGLCGPTDASRPMKEVFNFCL